MQNHIPKKLHSVKRWLLLFHFSPELPSIIG